MKGFSSMFIQFTILLSFVHMIATQSSSACVVNRDFVNFAGNTYSNSKSSSLVDLFQTSPQVLNPPGASLFQTPPSCLGLNGPIGSAGPLGLLGPIGKEPWTPSTLITGVGWDSILTQLNVNGGPLSDAGVLGHKGPLTDDALYNTLPCINDFAAHLTIGGVWTALGMFGPLGPLGALGPLGPVGAHGFKANDDGQFVDEQNNVHRRFTVAYNSTMYRTFELYEFYTQDFASNSQDNDCSFGVDATFGDSGSSGDTYQFTSAEEQYVTIVLVPLNELDNFDLVISLNNQQVAVSDLVFYVDFVQIRVPKGAQLTATVQFVSSGTFFPKQYRLFVNGSTRQYNKTPIAGSHLIAY